MKIHTNSNQTVLILDTDEELDKVFALNQEDLSFRALWGVHGDHRVKKVESILSVTEFKPEVKAWLLPNIGDYKSGQYWVKWAVYKDANGFSVRYKARIFFKDAKYASLFRLIWL